MSSHGNAQLISNRRTCRYLVRIAHNLANMMILLDAIHGKLKRAALGPSPLSPDTESQVLVCLDWLPWWQGQFLQVQQALSSPLASLPVCSQGPLASLPACSQGALAVIVAQAEDVDLLLEKVTTQLVNLLSHRLCPSLLTEGSAPSSPAA